MTTEQQWRAAEDAYHGALLSNYLDSLVDDDDFEPEFSVTCTNCWDDGMIWGNSTTRLCEMCMSLALAGCNGV